MGCCASNSAKVTGDPSGSGGGKKGSGAIEIKKETTKDAKEGGLKHSGFIIDNQGKITEFYDIDKKKLGEGSYGAVSKCTNKSTGATRAVKSISKAQMKNLDRFKQEIAVMKIMDHPNIIKLFESFEDHRNIYLILELCTGGELFDRIIDSGHFTEVQAAIVMQNMFRAIFYMHENKICHRDLKPENFLFTTKEPIEKTHLKVIDFGLACKFSADQVLTTKAGTPYYVAPQVLAGKYDQSSDMWSLGVIMYVVLCGYPPFYGESDADVLAKVRLGNFSFNAADWKNVSEDAKNLIRMLLKMNPKDRYTAEQSLNHVWVRNKAPKATGVELQSSLVDNLKGFRSQNKLKKAALHVIASQLGESQIKALRDTFMLLDENGDGLLTAAEMKEGLTQAGLKEIPPDLQQILEEVDSDGSGVIDYTEFLAATLDKKVYMAEDVCWQAFRIFDRNGDGKIDKHEIQNVLNDEKVQNTAAKDLADIMQEIDKNGDGEIDFQEFMQMMRGGGDPFQPSGIDAVHSKAVQNG
jgi:calcium-dependent protein kinase